MSHEVYQTTGLPEHLREIPGAPKKLYYKGTWSSSIFDQCLAVVGARQMTGYGRRVTEQLVAEIAQAGITIVSGFMYGIDAAAHKAALSVGGRTIAVMPCGIERIHPGYQEDLYSRILDNGGLVLSEYAGDAQPQHWTYPQRNRIVAGLSQAVLVVEAGLKSGSLITANYATKYNRRIFAIPGSITSDVSQGTFKLIREGATPVADAGDVIKFFNNGTRKPLSTRALAQGVAETLSDKILHELRSEPQGIDMLARELNIPAAEIGTILSMMELRGAVKQEEEKYYAN